MRQSIKSPQASKSSNMQTVGRTSQQAYGFLVDVCSLHTIYHIGLVSTSRQLLKRLERHQPSSNCIYIVYVNSGGTVAGAAGWAAACLLDVR